MRVLIADDQKGVGAALTALVESCGHEVVQVVGSGLEAIQAYTRLKPDVVLMDFSMPRLGGATACRMILSKDPEAKIVIVTASASAATEADTGAVAVLSKPVDLEQLNAAMNDAVRQTSPPDETETIRGVVE